MAQQRPARLSFNRGLLDPLGAARVDLERHALSAAISVNWRPRALGSMMLRPGYGYIGASSGNLVCRNLPFVRSADNTARLEITESGLRVWVEDALVTRVAVSSAVTNGTFTTDVTSWTDGDESGATSAWLAGGYLSLKGTGTLAAIRTQQITVAGGDQGVEHALRIIIERGPVILRVGSTAGDDDYIEETVLGTGTHSLALTPTGNFHIRFLNRRIAASLVDSVAVEAAGAMQIPTPWADDDLHGIRYDQSADVLYVGCAGDATTYQQRKIERRGDTSWSVVLYEPEDGPFRLLNVSPVTIAASAITGDVTLTASANLFKSGHDNALFRMTSSGQLETAALSGADQFTDPIRVIGVGGQRAFSIVITGTWSATLTVQYSLLEAGSWVDMTIPAPFTANAAISFNDELDNQIVYYRIGIKAAAYTSGTANATLVHSSGSTVGIVRITAVSSSTSATAAVIDSLGSTAATADWEEGQWSEFRGYPSVPILFEGRLFWWGRDKAAGSESDLYEDFDDTEEGDAGPIQRSIGSGPIERAHWAAPLGRMLVGVATMSANVDCARINGDSPIEARSTSFDDPLTPTNFNTKRSAASAAYVDQSGTRVFEAALNAERQVYAGEDLCKLVPNLNKAGIAQIVVQHRPDLRIHARREDGSVGMVVFDRTENVLCWLEDVTAGVVEDICVLPHDGEDEVYYTVQRTIDGATVRYFEKTALESECVGGFINRQADAFVAGIMGSYISITSVVITGDDGTHTVLVNCGAAHGKVANDAVYIEGVIASGHYQVNGRHTVVAAPSATQLSISFDEFEGFPDGFYVSGGTFPTGEDDTIPDADHLEGETVVVWADGRDLGSFVVSGGEIALGEDVQAYCYGLPYSARWQSTRLGDALGISQASKLKGLGLILHNTHATGLRYGQSFSGLRDLPQSLLPMLSGARQTDHIFIEKETGMLPVKSEWTEDSRLCLEAHAPKPCCVLAAVPDLTKNVS